MKRKLTTIARLILAGGIIFVTNQIFATDSVTNSISQTNEPSPFKIIVTPKRNRVHVKEPFQVSLMVKNISNTNQQFKVWSCSWYENWKSSKPAIGLRGWACTANRPVDIHLTPGESFKEELNGNGAEMEIFQPISTNEISFRMGFIPTVWGDIHIYNPAQHSWRTNQSWIEDRKTIYWSDEVNIKINPKWIPDWIP